MRSASRGAPAACWRPATKKTPSRCSRQAFKSTIESGPSRVAMPRFSDDPNAPRYLLPGEEHVQEIVHEISRKTMDFCRVVGGSSRKTMAFAGSGSLLSEQGLTEAQTLIDLITECREPPTKPTTPRALTVAAQRRSLRSPVATGNRPKGSIGWRSSLVEDDTIKRSWWFNLADIEQRLDDEGQRQIALRAAADPAGDDIARRGHGHTASRRPPLRHFRG